MEANTCCLCKQPYYRMDALSGTPRRRVVLPVGDSSRAPYRLWPCGHGAHKLCLAAQGPGGTSMNGPCKVCGSSPCALDTDLPATKPREVPQCSVPLTPPARWTQENNPPPVAKHPMKTDDNGPELEKKPEAAPKKMPRLSEYARREHGLPPWRRQRTNA